MAFARILGCSWNANKRMATVLSNPQIEEGFDPACRAGQTRVSGYLLFLLPNQSGGDARG